METWDEKKYIYQRKILGRCVYVSVAIVTLLVVINYAVYAINANINICDSVSCMKTISNGTCTLSLSDGTNNKCSCDKGEINDGIVRIDCYMVTGVAEMCPLLDMENCKKHINTDLSYTLFYVNLLLLFLLVIPILIIGEKGNALRQKVYELTSMVDTQQASSASQTDSAPRTLEMTVNDMSSESDHSNDNILVN